MKSSPYKSFLRVFPLTLIALFFVVNNAIWWQQNKFIQGPDEGRHLSNSLKLLKLNQWRESFSLVDYANPPLYYATAAFFYKLFANTSLPISLLNNILYGILLLLGVSALEKSWFKSKGLLGPFLLLLVPAFTVHSRFFNPDIGVCALVAWFIFALKRLYESPKIGHFVFCVILLYLGGYMKVTFFIFGGLGILAYLCVAMLRKKRVSVFYNAVLAAAMLLVIVTLYPLRIIVVGAYARMWLNPSLIKDVSQGSTFSLFFDPVYSNMHMGGKFLYTLMLFANEQLGGIMCLFFVISIVICFTSALKKLDVLVLPIYFIGALVICAIARPFHLEARYFLPLVSLEAIVCSFGLQVLYKKNMLSRLIVIGFTLFFVLQYYGISYAKGWFAFFERNKLFHSINLSYDPLTSHYGMKWSVPYSDNPLSRIVEATYKGSRQGIIPFTCILYEVKRDPFAAFLAEKLEYYWLQKDLMLQGNSYQPCCTIMKKEFNQNMPFDLNYVLVKSSLRSQYEEGCFKQFFEKFSFRPYKNITLHDVLSGSDDAYVLFERVSWDFASEALRKYDQGFKKFKLRVFLKNGLILRSEDAVFSPGLKDSFRMEWLGTDISLECKVTASSNQEVQLSFSTHNAEELSSIEISASSSYQPPLYIYKNKTEYLFKGAPRRIVLENSRSFSHGMRDNVAPFYVECVPFSNYKGYLSQVFIHKDNEVEFLSHIQLGQPSLQGKIEELFSFRLTHESLPVKERKMEEEENPRVNLGNNIVVSFRDNALKVFSGTRELTSGFGLYLSIFKEFWHDPQDVVWSVQENNGERLVIRGDYVNLPASVEWVIASRQAGSAHIEANMTVKEYFSLGSIDIGLMLDNSYSQWQAKSQESLVKEAPFKKAFANAWRTEWQSKADQLRVSSQVLPSISFKNDGDVNVYTAGVKTTNTDLSSFVFIYAKPFNDIVTKGTYRIFNGTLTIDDHSLNR